MTGSPRETARFGNDLSTLPNFPAEIRAPAGHPRPASRRSSCTSPTTTSLTAGRRPRRAGGDEPGGAEGEPRATCPRGADIIVNTDEFTTRNLAKVGYAANPLEDGSLESYAVHPIAADLADGRGAQGASTSRKKEAERAKNMFALGLLSWLYRRPTEGTLTFLEQKFAKKPEILAANLAALRGRLVLRRDHRGLRRSSTRSSPRRCRRATYRNITGNLALAYGLIAAAQRAELPLFLGSYPITPASDILHELSKHKNFGVMTFQAEDEIAGVGAALGAAYGGALGVTTTSGPGRRAEVRDDRPGRDASSCRWSSSTCSAAARRPACPTKTEQADLLQAMFGRNGEAPVPIVAPQLARGLLRRRHRGRAHRDDLPHPGVPALRRLRRQRLRAVADPGRRRAARPARRRSRPSTNHTNADGSTEFWPYLRDPETLARPWAVPGTPGLEHRIGGLEKADGTGNISYDPDNHDTMVRLRQAKIDGIAVPDLEVDDPDGDARVLVLGWGSTYGPIGAGLRDRAARRASASPRPTCATSTRSRPTSARCCAATTRSSCPR